MLGRLAPEWEELMFELDERLANDTIRVGDLALSTVLLMNDSRFPWAILAPRRAGLVEFHDLSPDDRQALMEETALVSVALQKLTGAQKMNIAALGNAVRQLHVHVVARFDHDDAWPRPIWGVGEALPYAPSDAQSCAATLKTALGI